MSKTAESREEPCRHVSMHAGCRHCEIHTYKLRIGSSEVEVDTGLFTCRNSESSHYNHVFTKGHRMCGEWD